MAEKLVQVDLKSGTTLLTCWVPARVKAGDRITLKNSDEPGRLWDVRRVGTEQRETSAINRGWNNNI